MTETYRHSWANTASYGTYEERRMFVEPALNKLIGDLISEHFAPGGVVLEVGAGAGALRRYAGEAGDQLTWVESEHYEAPLQLPRSIDTPKAVVALPDIPFRPGSLDGVISLGVLDTLSTDDLEGTAKSVAEVLTSGGKVIHLLDMSPDYVAEIKNSKARGLFPLLFNGEDENKTLGIHYVAIKNLARRVSRLPIDQSMKNVFVAIVNDPQKHMTAVNRTGILQLLGSVAEEYDMVIETEPNWLGKLANTLSLYFEEAGLKVVRDEIVTTQTVVDERCLPPQIHGRGATDVIRKQGWVDVLRDESGLILPGRVRLHADSQVLVAVKED